MNYYSQFLPTEDLDYSLIEGFLRGLKPDPILTVSEWSDSFRVLPSTVAEPGPWRTSRTPYLKEIMDKLSVKDPAQEIWWQKPSQCGATEAGNNWLGYIIDIAPAATMYVMPTDGMMKKTSKTRIQPMINESDRLRKKIKPSSSKEGGNTILDKEFEGGYLTMIGANSPVGLSSTFVRFLYMDELDRYPQDVGGEGDVIGLAKTRTSTFGDRRKIFGPSTPTIDGQSIIAKEVAKTGQRHYFVPCPHCGGMQYLKFSQLRYEPGKYANVKYECEHCHELIEERQKTKMLAAGQWQALFPDKEDGYTFGYVMNALYSPLGWYSWGQMAKEHDEAQNDIPKMIVFTNTKLGETYKIKGDQPEWELLYNKREDYQLNRPNSKVVFITAGVDIQLDRIEVEIVGWGKGKESWSIDYRVFHGNTDSENNEVWNCIGDIVNEVWEREDGALLPLHMMAVDSGNNTNVVYSVCRKYSRSKVIPIKGRDSMAVYVSQPKAVDTSRSGKAIKNVQVWMVGVSLIKTELYGWLKLQKLDNKPTPYGYCHFPMYDEDHFKSITAEKIEYTKDKKGYEKPQWVKKYERNERLDCFDDVTEVLTHDGWKLFKDLVSSDKIATVNIETDLIEYQSPTNIISRHHSGQMIELKGKRLDLMVTPEHRMVTYKKESIGVGRDRKWNFDVPAKITLARDLTIHHQIKCSSNWIGSDFDVYIPASISDQNRIIEPERYVDSKLFASFIGWYVSEGGRFKGASKTQGNMRYRIEISQTKISNIEIIEDLLKLLPWSFRYNISSIKFSCTSKQLYDYLDICGGLQATRCVPAWLKECTPETISNFIDAAMLGDGWVQQKYSHHKQFRTYATTSKKLADDVQELLLKTGKASNIRIVKAKPYFIKGRYGTNTRDQYHVTAINNTKASLDSSISGKRAFLGKSVDYNGMVYCASVPNETLIVRRNGKASIAGNCRVYARAAAFWYGIDRLKDEDWDSLLTDSLDLIPTPDSESQPDRQRRKRSSYWNR